MNGAECSCDAPEAASASPPMAVKNSRLVGSKAITPPIVMLNYKMFATKMQVILDKEMRLDFHARSFRNI
jgi:hypothetical protein